MADKKIILLGSNNPTTWIVYNELVEQFGTFPAIIEQPLPRSKLLKTRIRKLGLLRVASQVGFASFLRPILRLRGAARIHYLKKLHGLEAIAPMSDAIQHVESVNGLACHALLDELNPDIVVVNGTRILTRKTLAKLNATVINTHQGITPGYRGAHGAYWALAQNDPKHCGVTVHLVDEGIDTGNIIAQAMIVPDKDDTFVTYPYLQTAKALDLLVQAVRDAISGNLKTRPISGSSAVWYHPGLFQYLGLALRGVR
jgi:folate-dependent phosphoribosylglycinamide formyltransferase PurN